MQYTKYIDKIVNEHNIKLVGWTHPHFRSPSTLGSGLPELEKLAQALEKGECHFMRVNAEEKAAHIEEYNQLVKDGKRPLPTVRKKRAPNKNKRTAAARSQDESSDDAQSGEDGSHCGNTAKRRRITKT